MIEKKKWQIGVEITYWKHEITENYHVTLQCLNQTIVVLPRAFKRIVQMDYNGECGCREITIQMAVDLGFIFPSTYSVMGQQDVI